MFKKALKRAVSIVLAVSLAGIAPVYASGNTFMLNDNLKYDYLSANDTSTDSTPTPSADVTPEPTPVATNTPVPVVTPVPTSAATETPAPVVTPSPTAIPTTTPTAVPTTTVTPAPSTATPSPIPTSTATPTPNPTKTPTPSPTATPTPTPSVNQPVASYDSSRKNVTLSCSTSGVDIYYTLNGSTPTSSSNYYRSSSTIYVDSGVTLKAIAYKNGYYSSVLIYNSQITTPTANISTGSFSGSQTVTLSCSTSDVKIYYTLNGTTPNNSSNLYTSSFTISSTTTLTVIAYNSSIGLYSNTNTYTYTIGSLSAPTANYSSGSYNSIINVTLSCSTSGVNIYYTTDGSTPTSSSKYYSSPIQIGSQTTLKVIAYGNGLYSSVTTYDYTFSYQNPAVDAPIASIASGTYKTTIIITLSCPTSNAQIYYTTNGTEPNSSSKLYSGPITISNTTTLKAAAYKSNLKSGISTYYYTIGGTSMFSDLGNYAWAETQISVLAQKGIIKGTSNTTFSPAAEIKRADFICLLVRTLGLSANVTSNFDDVGKGDYYYNELGVAKALGITKGVGGNLINPKSLVSRQDMMVLVSRALVKVNKIKAIGSAKDLSKFTDSGNVSDYAVNDVASLIKEGIVQGSGNSINPKGTATRAETAVIMYRILNK